ncbi:MAG: hypothetical protein ACD_79C00583G0004 [uncultured bacterium]|nr:MAG: hypothetical protein ACD_79C00583G0004 [uncultured bacterium]
MELSEFLQTPASLKLRQNFFAKIEGINNKVIERLNYLNYSTDNDELKLKVMHELFGEVHRIKGTGGTYGFNEISNIYIEILKYVRPPHNETRLPELHEIENSTELAEIFSEYFKVLKDSFAKLSAEKPCYNGKSVFIANYSRDALFYDIEFFCIKNKIAVFSALNFKESSQALKYIQPDIIISDHKFPDDFGYKLIDVVKNYDKKIKFCLLTNSEEEFQIALKYHPHFINLSKQNSVEKIIEKIALML